MYAKDNLDIHIHINKKSSEPQDCAKSHCSCEHENTFVNRKEFSNIYFGNILNNFLKENTRPSIQSNMLLFFLALSFKSVY